MSSSTNKSPLNYKVDLVFPDSIKIGIVVSEWHPEITEILFQGAEKVLLENRIKKENIIRKNVPGSFELPLGAQLLSDKTKAVICLGCVMKGETDHYRFICNAVANGIMNVGLKANLPVSFGVLTTGTIDQALARAGGKYGNKGEDSAYTVLKMLTFLNR
ncbi:MAG: 6,7-dimethyl-8-ribityllumazine synthase [Bacteroidetes bacterium]|nr:MAG: 6,7-dimethyl-8-ribityllumazine synthase [Bacteroidota bacterium]